MLDYSDSLPLQIYEAHLKTINRIRFSRREIDIIAFLVNGRAVTAIAAFFSISPKTVSNHILNVMHKLDYNSRDKIIDFIQKSSSYAWIRKYYFSLLLENIFKIELKKVSTKSSKELLACTVVWRGESKCPPWHVNQLKDYLRLCGIKVSNSNVLDENNLYQLIHRERAYNMCLVVFVLQDIQDVNVLVQDMQKLGLTDQQLKEGFIFLCINNATFGITTNKLVADGEINCFSLHNYYDSVFILLKKLGVDLNLEQIQEEFSKNRQLLSSDLTSLEALNTFKSGAEQSFYHSKLQAFIAKESRGVLFISVLSFFSIGALLLLFIYFGSLEENTNKKAHTKDILQSELVIPVESKFLKRMGLVSRIDRSEERRVGKECRSRWSPYH